LALNLRRQPDTHVRPHVPRPRWWREVLYVLAFYLVYSVIRNEGIDAGAADEARRHALEVIDLERRLGTFHEAAVQHWFLRWPDFIRFWNVFYGTAHFIVTVGALVYLFRRMGHRYPLWRNTLACTTGLALVGYALYPLMPPRLLDASYGFVDTLEVVGGLWSFDSGPVAKISNQYAAMPSLHFAWSAWCTLALLPAARRLWVRALLVAYPFLTLFAIVVTANHFWLDAAGGAVTLAAGFLLGLALTRLVSPAPPAPLGVDGSEEAEPAPPTVGPEERPDPAGLERPEEAAG